MKFGDVNPHFFLYICSMQVEIKDKLYKDIVGYCETNNLDVNVFINDLLKKGFTVEKYGERPEIFEKQAPNAEEFKPVAENLTSITTDEEPDLKEMVKAALANKTEESEEITLDSVKEVIKQAQVAEPQEEEQPKKRRRKLS